MKKLLSTLLLSFVSLISLNAQELGYISDPDGYTNLRIGPSGKSKIIGVIITGQEFQYHPSTSSDWWKVNFGFRTGYIYKSRIQNLKEIQAEISSFFQEFYSTDRNNAELSEVNSEKLFNLIKDYPLASLNAFCEQNKSIQEFLISEYESPVYDQDFQLIYSRLKSVESSCSEKTKVIDAIQKAAADDGIKVKASIKKLPDYNRPDENPSILNEWFTSELDGKPISYYLNNPKIDTYAKMFYQGQFAPSDDTLTLAFLDSVLTTNPQTLPFYLFVFNSVLPIADGALAESIGSDCRAYLEKYPCSFIALKSSARYADNYQKWINYAAYEYFFENEPIKTINKKIDLLKPEIQASCPSQIDELENIRKQLIEFVKKNSDN